MEPVSAIAQAAGGVLEGVFSLIGGGQQIRMLKEYQRPDRIDYFPKEEPDYTGPLILAIMAVVIVVLIIVIARKKG